MLKSESTEYARHGYNEALQCVALPNPHMFSSPCWMLFEAGLALGRNGNTRIKTAWPSRGYRVRIDTEATEFLVTFSGKKLEIVSITRLAR